MVAASAACGSSSGSKSAGTNAAGPTAPKRAATTTTTVAPVGLAGLKWSRRPGGLPDAGNLNGLAAAHDGFIAVGVDNTTSGAAVWQSPDGQAWTKETADPKVFESKELPSGIASDGTRAVITGFSSDGAQGLPRAWYSTNGTTWTRAPETAFGSGAKGTFVSEHWGPKGFVGLIVTNTDAALAVSKDGTTWTVHKGIAASDPTARVNDVIGTDDGYVAVGVTGKPGAAEVWTSADGDAWTAVKEVKFTDPYAHRFVGMNTVIANGDTLLAGGARNDGAVEVGSIWARSAAGTWGYPDVDNSFHGVQGSGIDAFATEPSGQVLAVGHATSSSRGYAFGAWSSVDGTSFKQVATSGTLDVSQLPKVTGVAVTSKAAVALARLQEFDPSRNSFVTRDLAVFLGVPS